MGMREIAVSKEIVYRKRVKYRDIIEINDDDYEKLLNDELNIETIVGENYIFFRIFEEREEVVKESIKWKDNL